MADMPEVLPSVAELAERIGRHQREMLDAVELSRAGGLEGVSVAVEEGRSDAVMLAAVVQAELAVLDFVMPRYVVSKEGEPAEYWTGPEWAQFRGYRSW